jgi:Tol biopolymer transport system component
MSLTPGARVGPYEVIAPLGSGGMGQVFRARDSRLGRDVAVKVLPPGLAGDPARLSRFEREARALGALNHPNIASIYGLETHDGAPALVLELVEGETLEARIARGPLPVGEALAVARQVAEALEAAHEAGVVHRDLKPGNVALTRTGVPKLLDFGLAKPSPGPPSVESDERTLTAAATREGVVLGTAAYMSPEQARGQAVDKRTDIWAFGCVLYEMLTGRVAFAGATFSDTLAAILQREPDLAAVPAAIPQSVRRLLERCLVKDPRRRLRDIGDALPELDLASTAEPPTAGGGGVRVRRRWLAVFAAAALLLAVAVAIPGARSRPAALDTAAGRFVPLAVEPGDETSPAWSPDGRSVAYAGEASGTMQIFTRSLDAAVATQITRGATSVARPFWSPDGARIYFTDAAEDEGFRGDLWVVGATGGEPQLVLQDAPVAALAPDGQTLAFLRGVGGDRSLWIRGRSSPDPQQYRTPPFPERFNRSPSVDFSRDGSKLAVLLVRQQGASFETELWVVPYPSGTPRSVLAEARDPIGGRISWMPDNRHIVMNGEYPDRTGSHLYLADTEAGTIVPLTAGTVNEAAPAVSPRGDRIAFAAGGDDADLVRVPLDGSRVEPLLASARYESWPSWSPTGSQLAYVTNARGPREIWLRSVDEGWARPVVPHAAGTNVGRPAFSPDGQRLAFELYAGATHTIQVASVADGRGVPLDADSRDQHGPAWSPDSRWIAYQRLGREGWEVVKAPSGGGAPVHLAEGAPGGGVSTGWSPSGEWIAYVKRGLLLSSSDGRRQRKLCDWEPAAFAFSADGSSVYAVRHDPDRSWMLVRLDVATGRERQAQRLDFPPRASLLGLSLHPGGRAFAAAMGVARHDIWLLEGLVPPSRGLGFFGR